MKTMRVVALFALTSAVASWTADAQTLGQGITVSKDNRTIAVTATDSVTVTADVATVNVGFVVYGVDHDSAYAEGSKTSNAIMDALKKAGVPSDAIKSQNQSLSVVQPFQLTNLTDSEKAQRKWVLTQSWTVRANAADAARVLDVAVKAGANQSGRIVWNLKDENAPQAQAAEKALQRARAVAEVMAKGLNVKLGALLFASNTTSVEAPRPGLAGIYGGSGQTSLNASYVEPLAVNPRQITKTATVYAVFAIE
jgi:uncharacterized protein YggE